MSKRIKRIEDPNLLYKLDRYTNYLFKWKIYNKPDNVINKNIADLRKQHEILNQYAGTLYKEVFEDLFKDKIVELPEEERPVEAEVISRPLHEHIKSLPELNNLRKMTKGNTLNSLISLNNMSKNIKKIVEEVIKENKQEIEDLQKEKDPQKKSQLLTGLQKKIVQAINKPQNRNMLRKSISQSKRDIKTVEETEAITYGSDPSKLELVDPEERLKVYESIKRNPQLKEITKLIGKLKSLVLSLETQEIIKGSSEITDIVLGSDINRILPSQLMGINNKLLKLLLYKNIIENNVMQYNLSARESKAQGDIVILVDTSSSMEGERIVVASAVMGAVIHLARREKRKVTVVFFASGIKEVVKDAEKKVGNDFIQLLSIEASGGTDFMEAFEEGFKHVNKNSDILMITDGECYLDKDIIKRKKAGTNTRIFTISLHVIDNNLAEVSDLYLFYEDLQKNLVDMAKLIKSMKRD